MKTGAAAFFQALRCVIHVSSDHGRGPALSAPLSWDLIPTFLILAEELQYGIAARRLGISRHTLSRRVSRLEAQLGTTLVIRSTRRVGLTAAGYMLRELAIPIAEAMERALEQVSADRPEQQLSVGISTDLTSVWDGPVEAWVNARGAPAVLERRPPDDALRLVRIGELDLVLIAGELLGEPHAAVVGHEPAVVVFPLDHPAARQTAIRPGDLLELMVVVSDAGTSAHQRAMVEQLHGDPELPYLVVPRIGTIAQGLVHAARAHRAAAVALRRSVERTDVGGLAVLPMDPPFSFPVTLVARPGLPSGPFQALVDRLLSAPIPPDERPPVLAGTG